MEKTDHDSIPNETPLKSMDQWKAFSHPLRLGILRLLAEKALTNEELAKALGVASGKLYFHTKKLVDVGLIVPAGTRAKGPVTEKLYRAAARSFSAPQPEKGGERPPFETFVLAGLELYRTSWTETGGLPGMTEGGGHLVVRHTPERRKEFVERLTALFHDFRQGAPDPDAPGVQTFALTTLFHAVPGTPAASEETGHEN